MSNFWNSVLKMREKGRSLVKETAPKSEAVKKAPKSKKKAAVNENADKGTDREP